MIISLSTHLSGANPETCRYGRPGDSPCHTGIIMALVGLSKLSLNRLLKVAMTIR
jgi:hypothetical protein